MTAAVATRNENKVTFKRPSLLAAPPLLILEMKTPSSLLSRGLPGWPRNPPLMFMPSFSFSPRVIVSSIRPSVTISIHLSFRTSILFISPSRRLCFYHSLRTILKPSKMEIEILITNVSQCLDVDSEMLKVINKTLTFWGRIVLDSEHQFGGRFEQGLNGVLVRRFRDVTAVHFQNAVADPQTLRPRCYTFRNHLSKIRFPLHSIHSTAFIHD